MPLHCPARPDQLRETASAAIRDRSLARQARVSSVRRPVAAPLAAGRPGARSVKEGGRLALAASCLLLPWPAGSRGALTPEQSPVARGHAFPVWPYSPAHGRLGSGRPAAACTLRLVSRLKLEQKVAGDGDGGRHVATCRLAVHTSTAGGDRRPGPGPGRHARRTHTGRDGRREARDARPAKHLTTDRSRACRQAGGEDAAPGARARCDRR